MTDALYHYSAKVWLALVKSAAAWPPGTRNRMAKLAAFVLWHAVPSRRHITLTNLRLCFPEKSEKEREALARRCYFCLARAAIDHGTLFKGTKEEVQKLVEFSPNVQKVLLNAENRPLIIVSPHFCGLDAAGIALNTVVRGIGIYQKQTNDVWDKAVLEGRKRFSDPVLIQKNADGSGLDLRKILRAMREGLPFYYLPDMDYGIKNAIFVDFFGVPAATIDMVGRLARVSKAKVIFCATEMRESGYYLHLSDIWEDFPSGDPRADTERVTRETEKWIRKFPEQYMWTHRRFKTRPEGEKSVY